MGLRRPKHFKCVHPESVVHMELVLFSSFSSRPSLFYKSEEAEGAQSLDHIASPTPCLCELIQVSTCAEHPCHMHEFEHFPIEGMSVTGKITNT
jgi:hypothetical protein